MPANYPVFISYRREDSPGHAGRMYDRLRNRFGTDSVFWDIELEPGSDFVQAIEDAVGSCEVLVAVIGRFWIDAKDTDGRRRLENPEDFVRLEIETALRRNVLVIPVLVFGATMPRSAELPEGLLRNLARKNALEISDRRFDDDVDRLMRILEKVLTGAEARAQLPEPLQRLNVRPGPILVPQVETKEPAPVAPTDKFNGLYFSKDHEWIKVEGNVGTVGISNHAQELLGDIVYIELPRKGHTIAAHDSFGSVESVKAVSELFCPVSGTIIEINENLNDAPERVNQSPYEDGWMIKVSMNNPADVEALLTRSEYDDFTRMESY